MLKKQYFKFILISLLINIPLCWAYIDPGAGSSLFQILAGSFLIIGLIWKLFWNKVKNIFKKKEPENEIK